MKISCPVKEITVTQKSLGIALGLTGARVNQMVQEGIAIRNDKDKGGGVYLFESLKNYWTSKGNIVQSDSEDLDYNLERAKNEIIKRKIAEIKLKKLENTVYDARTVELVMTEMYSNLRTQLLGLPSKLAPRLEGKTKENIYELLTKDIESQLMELSDYTPEMFMSEKVEEADTDEDSS